MCVSVCDCQSCAVQRWDNVTVAYLSTTHPHLIEIHHVVLELPCVIKIATACLFVQVCSKWVLFVKNCTFDPIEQSTRGKLAGNEGLRKRGVGNFDTAGDDNLSVGVWLEPS